MKELGLMIRPHEGEGEEVEIFLFILGTKFRNINFSFEKFGQWSK